ncbi:hypothetical protein [Roseobacter sinensis]|uniref:Periplasmic heavy metal sensor n=1 Tax=Roseobacter sinensis TaxID=2931391 RepID=A0ABT3B9P6_9RHOB|nr:hypothetical protein [Roseobacter sp. WL0113]MCV3269858.1 hypothetical protein [Roseobacter sp. WL0113]
MTSAVKWSFVAALVATGLVADTAHDAAPYAGQDTRAIATLSAQDVDDLLAGRGWGFALAAELNGYPGPTHVLELADALALTAEQRAAVEDIFARMNADARRLGAELVAAEAALGASFAEDKVDSAVLTALVAEAGRIEADLRAVHLAAHLETKPLMSRHQVMLYNQARGYRGGGHGGHDHD